MSRLIFYCTTALLFASIDTYAQAVSPMA